MLLLVLTGWLERHEREALAYLIEENHLVRRQLGGRQLRLTDDDRRQHHVPICDRDRKWSAPVRARLGEAGIRVVQTPYRRMPMPMQSGLCVRLNRSVSAA